mgnify:CR=1 FL=1
MSEWDNDSKDTSVFGEDNKSHISSPDWHKGIVNQPLGTTELVKTGKLEADSDAYGRRICILSTQQMPKDGSDEVEITREVYIKVGRIFPQEPYTKQDGTVVNPDYKMAGNIDIPVTLKQKKLYLYENAGGSYGLVLHDKKDNNET